MAMGGGNAVAVAIDPSVQMWATFALIFVALVFYMIERVAMELTSLAVICALLVLFHLAPLADADGRNLLGAARLLEGFANPALITIVALLVVGEGLVRTGVLDQAAVVLMRWGRGHSGLTTGIVLLVVAVVSAVMNNIPVVVIFIPIMQLLARYMGRTPAALMMPLSFAAMLGGNLTLIGSSTNLLVSGTLVEIGETPFGFFDFAVPGLFLGVIGFAYLILVAPRLLPERGGMERALSSDGKQFVAQITVADDSKLVGIRPVAGFFAELKDITVRMIQRGENAVFAPFEEIVLEPGDVLVVAATRQALAEAARGDPLVLHPVLSSEQAQADEDEAEMRWRSGAQMLAEVMVTPNSRMVGQTLARVGFRYQHHCIVLGIQRRARMILSRVTAIRLEAGDVLLIQGRPEDVGALRGNRDVLLMEWSAADLPAAHHTRTAGLIFLGVVASAASVVVPIVIAALAGAVAMIGFGVLNVRQAARAIDRKIMLIIPTALALSAALTETGGAGFLSHAGTSALEGAAPAVLLSALFLVVALMANVMSNKATAVLFTPIAVGLAHELGVDPHVFAVAVIFAANAAFASPVGYQTNLIVMAPGHYKFTDFIRAGLPLVLILWVAFSLFAPWYYGL